MGAVDFMIRVAVCSILQSIEEDLASKWMPKLRTASSRLLWFSLPSNKIHHPHHLSIVLRYIASGKCSFTGATLSTLYELLGEKIREAHKSRKSNKGRVAEQDLDLISDRPTGSHDRL
ncbi:hypothetical protein SELMODRAFT_426396 [Selaginella moellendorffii]|uniref:Uncharacterized protein n=1 Tax=Selaginella moellendorffii TaxID=88036 RepID=D8SW89_SELML|nr:hypothetical protein SELMODRAFT_426396 [Selaginella moellendorffii]